MTTSLTTRCRTTSKIDRRSFGLTNRLEGLLAARLFTSNLGLGRGWIGLIPALCVFTGCGDRELREWTPADHGQPTMGIESFQERVPEEPAPASNPTEMAAQALWQVHCAGCHGETGRGDGQALPPSVEIPDMASSSWQNARDDRALEEVIGNGRGMMPRFGDRLSAKSIASLVHHIRTLASQ